MDPEDEQAGDGKILSPEELELTDKDGVEEIDEGRYVVSANGEPAVETTSTETTDSDRQPSPGPTGESPSASGTTEPTTTPSAPETGEQPTQLDTDAVQDWTEQQLRDAPTEFGYHISMKSDGNVNHHTLYSDDITATFNNLLLWYARTVDQELPPGAVLGILLSEANVPVKYPVKSFEEFLINQGLSTEDTIGELLATLREEDEFVFPPRR